MTVCKPRPPGKGGDEQAEHDGEYNSTDNNGDNGEGRFSKHTGTDGLLFFIRP
jgi:hypothetical protein